MPIPNTDTRRLKRLEDGQFTMRAVRDAKNRNSLCDSCGRLICPIQEMLDDKLAEHIRADVHSCGKFVPVFSFSVRKGLHLPAWNTIRIGQAWAKRLRAGEMVAIVDSKEETLVRHMIVESMAVGTMREVCEAHAENNHAILHEELTGSMASDRLTKILRNAYGSNFAGPDRMATAIYLRSCEDEAGSL